MRLGRHHGSNGAGPHHAGAGRLVVAALVGWFACVSAGSAAAGSPAVATTQLALMPLPKAALGSDAGALPLDPDSGVVTNQKAASDANGAATAATMTRLGRITGYALDFDDKGGTALSSGHGLLEIQTGVHLYRGPAAAQAGLEFWRKDELKITRYKAAGILVSLTAFSTPGLGAASFGFAGVIRVKGKPAIYGCDTSFVVGQLVAAVSVSAADSGALQQRCSTLATALHKRIGQVLAGKIKGPPVPLPEKAKAGPPPGGPSLIPLALTTKDLGTATVSHEGYQLDSDLTPISQYDRQMTLGGSAAHLEEEISLFHSATEASYKLKILGNSLGSAKALRAFAGKDIKDAHIASYEPQDIRVTGGDEARAILATVTLTDGRSLKEGFVFVRVGSTMEFITLVAAVGVTVVPSDLAGLARIAAARAAKGLGSGPVA